MGEWKCRIQNWKEAARGQNLFGDQDILRQVSRECITDSDLFDSFASVSIALAMKDGGVVHCRLEDVSFPRAVTVTQTSSDFHQRYGAFVTEDERIKADVPPVNQLMIGPLVDQLKQGSANARRVHTGEQLPALGTRGGHRVHS
jgi:hypothetical protein